MASRLKRSFWLTVIKSNLCNLFFFQFRQNPTDSCVKQAIHLCSNNTSEYNKASDQESSVMINMAVDKLKQLLQRQLKWPLQLRVQY